MSQQNTEYETLQALGITTASVKRQWFKANSGLSGFAIGQGKCKAVKLQLPRFDYGTTNIATASVLWYGTADEQTRELLQNTSNNSSDLIVCNDLNEVFIKILVDGYINILIYN